MITTRPASDDEFYIGYGNGMPAGIRRRMRAAITALGCAATIAVATVVMESATLTASRFEFGTVIEMSGILRRVPYPVLDSGERRVWLVGTGKWSASRTLAGVADGPVTLRGSRVQRGRHDMLEVHSVEPVRSVAGPRFINPNHEADENHEIKFRAFRVFRGSDSITLRGEIVDSKCFLGVMNPAEGAVHRDCARRCLSGGMPPMLLVRDGAHREELVLLVSGDGRAIGRDIGPAAGTPVDVTGRLVRDGKDFVLYVSAWRRRG